MIGVVIVTHGGLAREFVAALEHIVGVQSHMEAVGIGDGDMERPRKEIAHAVRNVDSGSGVIVLTDMFGGTPSNLAIAALAKGKVEVLAGVNLPMLIKLASVRVKGTLEQAVKAAQEAGRKYIRVASQELATGR